MHRVRRTIDGVLGQIDDPRPEPRRNCVAADASATGPPAFADPQGVRCTGARCRRRHHGFRAAAALRGRPDYDIDATVVRNGSGNRGRTRTRSHVRVGRARHGGR